MDYNTFEDFNTPLVIDNGSGTIKAGLAGRERPTAVIPSCVGIPKHTRVMLQAERKTKYFFNNQDIESGGLCRLVYPQKKGIISEGGMDNMVQLWDYIYKELIAAPPSDYPVLLTEAVHNPIRNRVDTAKIFFEQFNVPALYFAPPPVLSLYASGRLTGCVLDSGHGLTSVVPICEGFAIPHAIQRIDIGGNDITNHFNHLLKKSGGYRLNNSSSELEIVRKIKEKECELRLDLGTNSMNPSKINEKKKLTDNKNNYSFVDEDLRSTSTANNLNTLTTTTHHIHVPKYKLPDGTELDIGSARYRAPEILFDPSIIGYEYGGVQNAILKCINKCDLDLRKDLYKTIVLSGGTTNIKNFGRRLVTEIQSKVPQAKIKVYAPLERHLTTWIGGSLLSFLEGFRPMWITQKEYNDVGNSILFRKSFF